MQTNIKIAIAAVLLAGASTAASADTDGFDVDIFRPAQTQTFSPRNGGYLPPAQTFKRRQASEAGQPATEVNKWMERASQPSSY